METSAQEIFDMVVKHLRQQNSKSVEITDGGSVRLQWNGVNDAPTCLYRSKDGKRCAAGVVILDSEYKPKMEGKNIGAVIFEYGLDRLKMYEFLLLDLQRVHDDSKVSAWEEGFKKVATNHSLTYTPPTP